MTRDELREELTLREQIAGLIMNRRKDEDVLQHADRILSIPKIAEGIGMVVVRDISAVFCSSLRKPPECR